MPRAEYAKLLQEAAASQDSTAVLIEHHRRQVKAQDSAMLDYVKTHEFVVVDE